MSQDQKGTSQLYPVFKLLLDIRDSGSTRHAQRDLLVALTLRSRVTRNDQYLCWPSYGQLAFDCQRDSVTLQRAAKHLEQQGLIRRFIRPNRSNRFLLNATLIREQAETARELRARTRNAVPSDADIDAFEFPQTLTGEPRQAEPFSAIDNPLPEEDDPDMGFLRGDGR